MNLRARDGRRDSSWSTIDDDPRLSRPPSPGSPGNIPAGDDLRLEIGWERFEQLVAAIAAGILGLNDLRFRRYGTPGQAQHGIDLAGRKTDGSYTVIQCKHYEHFTPRNLRDAVERFTVGTRPFAAQDLIVAVGTVLRTTQMEDELAALRDEHQDLRIDLWGAEQLNDELRHRPDIVSRFWTRETAEVFCTGAPPPGVPAAPPNWVRVADQVLLDPLGVDGLDDRLSRADGLRTDDPASAADIFGELAGLLSTEGFDGHAHVLWRKQLDALVDAGDIERAAGLASQLAATALHEANDYQARLLSRRLDELARTTKNNKPEGEQAENTEAGHTSVGPAHKDAARAGVADHAELIRAALRAVEHPLDGTDDLVTALQRCSSLRQPPEYLPIMALLLAELTVANTTVEPTVLNEKTTTVADRVEALDGLITSSLDLLADSTRRGVQDIAMRLRLVRSYYNHDERRTLLTQARQLRLPRSHAALVLAAQARRDALGAAVGESLEHWRQAVSHAIHESRTDDAAAWLYAIRTLHTRYGPWTNRLNDEHLLAQALPKTSQARLIRRVRSPESDARRSALAGRPIEAIRATRRWLADSIVMGDWTDEQTATKLLGDLYADNAEPERAAACYQWAGETKKLTELCTSVGDRLLPPAGIGNGPWWQQATSLAGVAVQHDLLDDEDAGTMLTELMALVERARTGELPDNPTHSLALQAAKTACLLAGRGTPAAAKALLKLLSGDVTRGENQYKHHDEEHVQACLSIATHHPELALPSLVRIFDLAEAGAHAALQALNGEFVIEYLRPPDTENGAPAPEIDRQGGAGLTRQDAEQLRERLRDLAAAGRYEAGLATSRLGKIDDGVKQRAQQARDRILERPQPNSKAVSFGTRLVPDSFLATSLNPDEQLKCLERILIVAEDSNEAATNRQDALIAAGNLVLEQPDTVKSDVHARSRPFVEGGQDGSYLDSETTSPHPLSTMRINFGSPSLCAHGLRLAQCSAVKDEHRIWVRDRAATMLGSDDRHEVESAASVLFRLEGSASFNLDATLLASHPLPAVRQLAAVIASQDPESFGHVLQSLATDPNPAVRTLLARRLSGFQTRARVASSVDHETAEGDLEPAASVVTDILNTLRGDVRHSVRRSAAGLQP